MTTLFDSLIKTGWDPKLVGIYLVLAENGEMTVPEIQKKTTLSRASIYDALNELVVSEFVLYRKAGRVAYYSPAHPNKLMSLLEQKKRDTVLLEEEMKETVTNVIGLYSLALHKPGVKFFEGIEGFREALEDSLTAKETIYTYVDINALSGESAKINEEYVKIREKKGVKKFLILPSQPNNLQSVGQKNELTETRYLPTGVKPFQTSLQIYDNKVAFYTLRQENIISVIIYDKDIYDTLRGLFEFVWNTLKS